MTPADIEQLWAGRAEPILPTSSIERIGSFWRALGFGVEVWPDDDGYIVVRPGLAGNGLSIDYNLTEDHDPFNNFSMVYVTVADVDAVHESILAAGVAFDAIADDGLFRYSMHELRERAHDGQSLARVTRPMRQPWGKREIALFDPDNNLIRIGSAL
jgi:catechol 2,3-dioxygenase-like lactoylglutathione lyase family enzyme